MYFRHFGQRTGSLGSRVGTGKRDWPKAVLSPSSGRRYTVPGTGSSCACDMGARILVSMITSVLVGVLDGISDLYTFGCLRCWEKKKLRGTPTSPPQIRPHGGRRADRDRINFEDF